MLYINQTARQHSELLVRKLHPVSLGKLAMRTVMAFISFVGFARLGKSAHNVLPTVF